MKKTVMKFGCAAAILILFVMCFSSCSQSARLNKMDEDERALAAMEFIERNMNRARAYRMEISGNLSTLVMDIPTSSEIKGTQIMTSFGKDGFSFMSKTETKTVIEEDTLKSEKINGYFDGMMFQKNVEDGEVTQQIKSKLSAKEYADHVEEQNGDMLSTFDFEECVNKSCIQNEDKSWSLSFSGCPEEALDEIFEDLYGSSLYLYRYNFALSDVIINIEATEDLLFKSVSFNFVYKAVNERYKDRLPEYSIRMEYFDIGKAKQESIDLSDYTEVYDMRLIDAFETALSDRLNGDKLNFDIKITQKKGNEEERYSGSFERKNGKYEFDLSTEYEGYLIDIDYTNGRQTTTVSLGAQSQTDVQSMTNFTAESSICSLIDPGKISSNKISNIELVEGETDVYKFTIYVSDSTKLSSNMIDGTTKTVTFKIVDGKLMRYEYSYVMLFNNGKSYDEQKAICVYWD